MEARELSSSTPTGTVPAREGAAALRAPVAHDAGSKEIYRSGFYSNVGFVGASVLAAGLLLLVTGGMPALASLALVAVGGTLAALGWRRAWRVLESAPQA